MNWTSLFEDYNIPYVTRGPNTKKGNISIQCPWCGDDDPSEHLSVSLTKDAWACWRSTGHGGRSPEPLIQALIGCSRTQAKLIAAQYSAADPSTLDEALASLTGTSEAAKPVEGHSVQLELPDDFQRITKRGSGRKFWDYLRRRGFDAPSTLSADYNLMFCTTGLWKNRVIIPLYRSGELIGWTARSLGKSHIAPRYLSTSPEIKNTIFNIDEIKKGGRILFITEGPFDALKMDFYGSCRKARSTCVFGVNMTIGQICILRGMITRFKRTVLLFDKDATEASLRMSEWLPGALIGHIPEDYGKDPGSLTGDQVNSIIFRASMTMS